MPTLTVTPNPAPPSSVVAVAGSAFANAKTRLLLDGAGSSSNIFRPKKDGTFSVGITVASTAKTQTLVAQQQSGSTWSEKARTSIVVQATVPPPVEPPPTGRPFPAPVTSRTVTVPASIDATGATDVANPLKAFIDGVPDGSIIAFPAGAIYRLSTGIPISGHHLVFEGNGTTLRSTGNGSSMWSCPFVTWASAATVSDIVIRNFAIVGANPRTGIDIYDPGQESEHGVGIFGGTRIEVAGCSIKHTYGDAVYVADGSTKEWAADVWVHHNTFDYSGRNAFTINAAKNVLIENNTLDHIGASVLDFEPDLTYQGADGVTFRNNNVALWGMTYRYTMNLVACANDNSGPGALLRGVTVSGNTVTSGPPSSANTPNAGGLQTWIGKTRTSNVTFTNNTTTKAGAGPILRFEHVDNLTVYGNVQPLASGSLLAISDCTNVKTTPVEPPPVEPPTVRYPPDTTLTSITPPVIPAVPAHLAPVTDPTWGTRITRISNVAGVRNAYARIPAWNSDGTKLLLGYKYPGRMLNGQTYADIGAFSQVSGAVWSNKDPNRLFGVSSSSNIFYSQNATTGVMTALHTFTGYATTSIGGWGGVSLGDGEGCVDNNDKTVVLMTQTSAGVQGVLVYDIETDAIVASLSLGTTRPNNAHTTQSGGYVLVNWSSSGTGAQQGLWLYDRNLNVIRQLWTYGGAHCDPGIDSSGNEVIAGGPLTSMYRLSSAVVTPLLPTPNALAWGHFSCRNIGRPGWAYFSNYQWDSVPALGRDQVVAVKLDGSKTVEVFAFSNHRSNTYGEMPFAVPNRDGTKVCFGSEWGVPGTVYAYIAGVTV